MYGGGTVSNKTYQKWFAKFHGGDLSLDDAPWSGQCVEVDGDEIDTTHDNGQVILWAITSILNTYKSIKALVKV